jgi:hypothetical protein
MGFCAWSSTWAARWPRDSMAVFINPPFDYVLRIQPVFFSVK